MQSCATCKHRPYGEARFHIDCLIYEPWWRSRDRKPQPKDFGANCKRYEADATAERTSAPSQQRNPIE